MTSKLRSAQDPAMGRITCEGVNFGIWQTLYKLVVDLCVGVSFLLYYLSFPIKSYSGYLVVCPSLALFPVHKVKRHGDIDRRLLTARTAVDDEVLKPKLFKARRLPEETFLIKGSFDLTSCRGALETQGMQENTLPATPSEFRWIGWIGWIWWIGWLAVSEVP